MNKNDWKNEKLKEENESFDSEEETTEGSLIKNIKDFANSASKIYRETDYTSAAILYFKALFGVLDLTVLRKKGFIPKDHNDRFRILEKDFPEFYLILDKNFHICQEPTTEVAGVSARRVLEHAQELHLLTRELKQGVCASAILDISKFLQKEH